MTTEIKPGDVVNIHGGTKVRRGVVLRLLPGNAPNAAQNRILVLWGTGTHRPDRAPVTVEPRTAAGTMLGIEKVTYFYRGNVTICSEKLAERLGTTCPPELLIRLSALLGL